MTLELQDVSYAYKGKYHTVHAVQNVCYTFETGRFYAIMGKSGSGKTTLLSMLAGLMAPTRGEILMDGTPASRLDCNQLRRETISVIYQDFNLFPLLTVEENAAYSLVIRGVDKTSAQALAREKLSEMGIRSEQFRRLPGTLSGGEQQRVAIARALAAGSKILLADEPTGSLDSENSRNIIGMLQKLAHTEGYCVIIVTHDPAAASAADIQLHMQDGQLS